MTLSDVGVAEQQIDAIDGGEVDSGVRLLSVAEIQRAFRDLRFASHSAATLPPRQMSMTDRAHTSLRAAQAGTHVPGSIETVGPHTSPGGAKSGPHTATLDSAESGDVTPHPGVVPDAAQPSTGHRGDGFSSDWVAVVGAHSGAGASCVALAIADALVDASRRCRLIEAARRSRSGLVAAAAAELGTDPSGAWLQGSRGPTMLYRRVSDAAPGAWPEPSGADGVVTVVDIGLPAADTVPRLVAGAPRIVLVCRVTVPGMRLAERLLGELAGTSIVLAAVGPGRWPGEVVASLGPLVREIRESGQVATVPDDRHLQVSGPTNSALPKSVSHAGRQLLSLIDAVRAGSAGAAPNSTAQSAPRTKGTMR